MAISLSPNGGGFGSYIPTDIGGGGSYSFDLGGAIDEIGGAVVDAGTDWLASKIKEYSGTNVSGGVTSTMPVSPGSVQGLGELLEFCQRQPPPPYSASQADRGNWCRYAATDVLGIPHDTVWQNNDTKIAAYEYFRAYLAAFDSATGNKYKLAANIPVHSGQCGSTPCSDSPNANPYGVFDTLQQIGATNLAAIDSVVLGGPGEDLTVATATGAQDATASSGGESSSGISDLADAFKTAGENLLDTFKNVLTATAAGAATGAQTSSGAASQASSGKTYITLGVLLIVAIIVFRKVL